MPEYSKPHLSFYTDPKKRRTWFVAFMFTNSDGERKQFQIRGKINRETSEEERIKAGNVHASFITDLLKEGWNPFNETAGQFIRRQDGGFINRPRTIGESIDECYKIKDMQLTSNEGHRTYKYIYTHFSKWLKSQFLDKMKPHEFTGSHAMAYADQLMKEGKRGRGFNNYKTVIKVFFNMMVDRDIIEKNPFSKVRTAKVTEAEIIPFQDAELKAIREHLKKHDYNLYVFCQFIYFLFLRPIEILKLQVKHIDLTRGKINLPGAASKNRKSRSCDMPPALRIIIKDWLKYEHVNDYLFGKGLLTGSKPLPFRNQVTERHRAVLEVLKFEGRLSLYSWKYVGIINAYLSGISIEEIRVQAGHSSINITQIYMQKLGLLKPSSFGSVDY